MIEIKQNRPTLKNLLGYLKQDKEEEIHYKYYGYGIFSCEDTCKVKDLPPIVAFSKCFRIDCNQDINIYYVDGAL